jgi:hypothetical protein
MTIEDRVRRVLADAVADEPPLRGAPLQAALRRRRRRPVLAGAVAVVLVLAAVVGLVAVRGGRQRSLPTTVSTEGWKIYTNAGGNLRFRYPPDWRLEVDRSEPRTPAVHLVPAELANQQAQQAGQPRERVGFEVWLGAGQFWIGEDWFGTTSQGRLPNGRPYLRTEMPRTVQYSIDWGRPCATGDARCVPLSVRASLSAADDRLWERYRAIAETILQTSEQLRPTAPTAGDRSLPPCRPDQWRLVWPEEYAGPRGEQGTAIQGGVQYLEGPRCHFRISVRMTVEDADGRLLPVKGNPAATVVEGDLPVDGMQRYSGSWVIGGASMWRFIWDEWCNRGLPRATLRVSADGATDVIVPGLDPAPAERTFGSGCQDRGRPSTVAGWP